MRRDILAGCIGFVFTALVVFSSRTQPAFKKIEYSPFVHKPEFPVMTDKVSIYPVAPPTVGLNSYKIPEGTLSDSTTIDELMQLPLESGGFVSDTEEKVPATTYVKYLRFQCTKIRNGTSVELGGVRFLFNTTPIPFKKIRTWNPHTGESKEYAGGAWSDSDQLSVIFCFSEPLEVNKYELKSSAVSKDNDPVQWKVEGSMNGGFWTVLDDRTRTPTAFPVERNFVMSYIMRGDTR